jgi:hypothetical protein
MNEVHKLAKKINGQVDTQASGGITNASAKWLSEKN